MSTHTLTVSQFRRLEKYGVTIPLPLETAAVYADRTKKKIAKDQLFFLDMNDFNLSFRGVKNTEEAVARTIKRLSRKQQIWRRDDLVEEITSLVYSDNQTEKTFKTVVSKKLTTLLADGLILLVAV